MCCTTTIVLVSMTVNYYARNDPLVKLDRRAAELMKLTNDTRFQEVEMTHLYSVKKADSIPNYHTLLVCIVGSSGILMCRTMLY